MFINFGAKLDTSFGKIGKEQEIIKKSGIIDRRRFIHIFYDSNNPTLTCKVIQINISTTRGTNILFDSVFMNRQNGSLSFVAVYVYECMLNTIDNNVKDKFEHGYLSLLTAKRMDRETDYDRDITRNEIANLYSKTFSNYTVSRYSDSRILVHPKFYTQEHEYYSTGDYNPNGIMDDVYLPNILGLDIVDDVTTVFQQQPSLYETIKDTLLIGGGGYIRDSDPIKQRSEQASNTIYDVNYILGCDSMVNGGIFLYDSQLGMGFDKTSIICKEYMSVDNAKTELETFLYSLEGVGKDIEKKYGSIRLMYSPSFIGSKCKIIYKDLYDKSTVTGYAVSNSSKDSSYEVTEVVGAMIDDDSNLFAHKEIPEDIHYDFDEKQKIKSYFD